RDDRAGTQVRRGTERRNDRRPNVETLHPTGLVALDDARRAGTHSSMLVAAFRGGRGRGGRGMSDPFLPPSVPLMSAVKARNIARSCQAMANHLRDQGVESGTVRLLEQRSAWWMAYSIAL